MGAFPLLTSLALLPPAVPAGLTLPLLAALALLPPAPAQVQTFNVSNLGQADSSVQGIAPDARLGQSFDTGGTSTDRFTLTNVVVDFGRQANQVTAKIYTDSSGTPGTQVGSNLTRGSGTSGSITYTTSGVTLNGSSTYWVVFGPSHVSGNNPLIATTTSNDEDTASSTGWSLGSGLITRR